MSWWSFSSSSERMTFFGVMLAPAKGIQRSRAVPLGPGPRVPPYDGRRLTADRRSGLG
jgi:hypothetical protein